MPSIHDREYLVYNMSMIKNKYNIENKNKRIYSPVKRKILLLLQAGIALGISSSPRTQRRVFKVVKREWENIDRQYLYRTIKEFKEDRLVDYHDDENGNTHIVISERGKKRVLDFKIDEMKIERPDKWDKKWRVVFFDVPEKKRWARDAIREKLKELEFHELQKSVFIHPFNCNNEINFIIEYFEVRRYVRTGELINLTNEEELMLHFKLK